MVGEVSRNTVRGNSIISNKDEGVMMAFGATDNLIAENRIRDNGIGFNCLGQLARQ